MRCGVGAGCGRACVCLPKHNAIALVGGEAVQMHPLHISGGPSARKKKQNSSCKRPPAPALSVYIHHPLPFAPACATGRLGRPPRCRPAPPRAPVARGEAGGGVCISSAWVNAVGTPPAPVPGPCASRCSYLCGAGCRANVGCRMSCTPVHPPAASSSPCPPRHRGNRWCAQAARVTT